MTSRRIAAPTPGAPDIIRFPDPRACDLDVTTFEYVNFPAYPSSLASHFGNPDITIITSEVAAGVRPTGSYEGVLFPDLLIAFNVDSAARRARNGYLISEQGKPPDFVLEVASESTARCDETAKRDAYAAMGIPEYWRFDHTGGLYHRTHLAGDMLVGGQYQPIPISRSDEGHFWGRSPVLNLDLCWEEGKLRFWDPVSQLYLTTYEEEHAARRAAEGQRDNERQARAEAEERVRHLEEELRRRSNSSLRESKRSVPVQEPPPPPGEYRRKPVCRRTALIGGLPRSMNSYGSHRVI